MSSDVFVAVPSFNHAPFIERCLKSIIQQTAPPRKLLVIDDGSTDASPAIIERILADCPFDSELIARENRGLCATLNQALELSDGKFFAYIGSDDVWLAQFLGEQSALLEARPAAVLAFSHGYLIDENDHIIDATANWTDFADGNMLPHLLAGQIFPSAGVVYRRAALASVRWNEDSRLEDYELYLKLSAAGDFARNENILCGWRQHGANVSGDIPLMVDEWIAAQDRTADLLPYSRTELDRIQKRLRFEMVASFVRCGRRRDALAAFVKNFAGARSPAQIGRMLARLSIPAPLFRANLNRKRRRNIRRYGKLTNDNA